MGAAASVTAVYGDALKWFQQYIDKETYLADFASLDKGHQGLTYMDFRNWVEENAARDPDSCWTVFLTSGTVLAVAHKAAAAHGDFTQSVDARHIVDVSSFRALLIHLYATSILWRHFAGVKKQSHKEDSSHSYDESKAKLDFDDFCMACRSFVNAHCKEELTDEVLREDFELLGNGHNHVGFMQVRKKNCCFTILLLALLSGLFLHDSCDDHAVFRIDSKFLFNFSPLIYNIIALAVCSCVNTA